MFFDTKKYSQDYLTDKTFLTGVVTGLAGGLIIGLLFAPRAGKELRKRIAGSVEDQTDELQQQWGKAKSRALDTFDTVKTNVGHTASKAEDKAEELADDAKSGFGRLKDVTRFF